VSASERVSSSATVSRKRGDTRGAGINVQPNSIVRRRSSPAWLAASRRGCSAFRHNHCQKTTRLIDHREFRFWVLTCQKNAVTLTPSGNVNTVSGVALRGIRSIPWQPRSRMYAWRLKHWLTLPGYEAGAGERTEFPESRFRVGRNRARGLKQEGHLHGNAG
jgi:hypothetical protein